ncbi:hypothetical protein C8Q80DRAFT_1168282 [Daedaleopsis nitida]|nr:hypothetical protein C8Q80DRAFT_1168282 [Daedaleopsis nitida]
MLWLRNVELGVITLVLLPRSSCNFYCRLLTMHPTDLVSSIARRWYAVVQVLKGWAGASLAGHTRGSRKPLTQAHAGTARRGNERRAAALPNSTAGTTSDL